MYHRSPRHKNIYFGDERPLRRSQPYLVVILVVNSSPRGLRGLSRGFPRDGGYGVVRGIPVLEYLRRRHGVALVPLLTAKAYDSRSSPQPVHLTRLSFTGENSPVTGGQKSSPGGVTRCPTRRYRPSRRSARTFSHAFIRSWLLIFRRLSYISTPPSPRSLFINTTSASCRNNSQWCLGHFVENALYLNFTQLRLTAFCQCGS